VKTYRLQEDQGVHGPAAQLQICTTTLLSCSAIIFYNKASDVLGLFHYGSLSLGNPNVNAAIISMINTIKPSEIVLWTAVVPDTYAGHQRERTIVRLDNLKVHALLNAQKPAECTLTLENTKNFPGVAARANALVFESVGFGEAMPLQQHGAQTIANTTFVWVDDAVSNEGKAYSKGIDELAYAVLEAEMEEKHGK
jgi:hypothetical protein